MSAFPIVPEATAETEAPTQATEVQPTTPVDIILSQSNLTLTNEYFKTILNDYLIVNPTSINAVRGIIKGCNTNKINYIEPEFIPHLVRLVETNPNPDGVIAQIVNENYLSSELKADLNASAVTRASYIPPKATEEEAKNYHFQPIQRTLPQMPRPLFTHSIEPLTSSKSSDKEKGNKTTTNSRPYKRSRFDATDYPEASGF